MGHGKFKEQSLKKVRLSIKLQDKQLSVSLGGFIPTNQQRSPFKTNLINVQKF